MTGDAASLPDFNDQASSFKISQLSTNPPPTGNVNVPGVVTENAGAVANGSSKTWQLNVTRAANLRLKVTAAGTLNSRSVTVSFAGRTIPLSYDAGQTLNIDFPGIGAGSQTLSIRANTDGVSLGKVEFVTF